MTTMTQISHFTCDVCDHIASFFIKVGQYLAVAGQHRANSELKRLGYLNKDGTFNDIKMGFGSWEA